MKLRITVGAEDKLNGYTNIDPVSQFDGLNVDLRNLDAIVSDAECSEILADEIIDLDDFRKTLIYSYSRAKYFERTMKYVDKIIHFWNNHKTNQTYPIGKFYKTINSAMNKALIIFNN